MMDTTRIVRTRVVELARGWIGTPYRHQGTRRGIGCDCLGLVRGIWRELYGSEPEVPGPYPVDWALQSGGERLLTAAERHCGKPVAANEMGPGDLVVFRWRSRLPASHAGIVSGDGWFIHAYEGAAVIESALVPALRRRIAGVFRFPGVE